MAIVALLVIGVAPKTGAAQNSANASPQTALGHACDLAAASKYDRSRPANIVGVDANKIDPKSALPACRAALTKDPENPRLLFQMARAFFAGKDYNNARAPLCQGRLA